MGSDGDGAGVDGGATEPDTMTDTCRVEVSEEKYCKLIEVSCEVDADCADGWSCVEVGGSSAGCATTDPGSAPSAGTEMMSAGGASSGGDEKAAPMEATAGAGGEGSGDAPEMVGCEPQPVEVIKQCMPPGYEYVGVYYASDAGGSLGLPTSAGGLGSSESAADPSAPQAGADDNGGDVAANSAGGDSEDSSSGCSFGGGAPSSPLGFAGLLLGLAALVARRKY
jgi:MYXO-CTERM domain-containing protein